MPEIPSIFEVYILCIIFMYLKLIVYFCILLKIIKVNFLQFIYMFTEKL